MKKRQEKRKGINVLQIAEENQVSKKVIYEGLYQDNSLDTILKIQEEKKEKNRQQLQYLHEIGMPIEYESVSDFCKKERLNLKMVLYNIQNGMDFYDAVQNSFNKNIKHFKYIYFNIQLKSLIQKYNLDYNQIGYWLRNGYDYASAIDREIFTRIFLKNIGGRLNYLWNIYQNEFLKGIDVQDKITDNEFENFIKIYNRMQHIRRDLKYYEYLTSIEILKYQTFSLDERVQNVLLCDKKIPFTLSELYYILDFEYGLMNEFTYLESHQIWIFNGNREVLKKLKKPSN